MTTWSVLVVTNAGHVSMLTGLTEEAAMQAGARLNPHRVRPAGTYVVTDGDIKTVEVFETGREDEHE